MNDIKKRFLLFLIGCIGTRLLLVYAAKNVGTKYLPYMGYLALIPAIGFTYIYITGSRTIGGETFGEKIWWNNLRPLHALLYGLFAFNAINRNAGSWKILLLDVFIGLIIFLVHHYNSGNFRMIF